MMTVPTSSVGGSYAAIEAYVKQQMRRLNLPGAALAIVEGDCITHVEGFGRARPDGRPPAPQTPFGIGSTTKSVTALAVMQLVEAGMVDLDAPVQHYLPWFQTADRVTSAHITVRHLLNQTSGLPLGAGWAALADLDARPGAAERQARALAAIRPHGPPGAKFEYSNLNYNLLGLVIEAVAGQSYAAYLEDHIFGPLGMAHSHSSRVAARHDDMAVGHLSWFGVPIPAPNLSDASGCLASGQLLASAEDMARYLIAHLNGGRCGPAQILSPAGMAELHRPAVDAGTLFVKEQYAMGWFVESRGDITLLSHTGMVPDFFTYMALLPEQKRGVVLLLNVDHFTMQLTMAEVGAGLAMLLAGQPPPPIRLGAIPWAVRGLPLIPLLQVAGIVATVGLVRGWRMDPLRRPSRGRLWGQHVLLPLLPNVLLASGAAWLFRSRLFGFMRLFAPDVTATALLSGGIAGLWAILRTGLVVRAATARKTEEVR